MKHLLHYDAESVPKHLRWWPTEFELLADNLTDDPVEYYKEAAATLRALSIFSHLDPVDIDKAVRAVETVRNHSMSGDRVWAVAMTLADFAAKILTAIDSSEAEYARRLIDEPRITREAWDAAQEGN